MATYKKQLKDKNGNIIYPDVGLNLDAVVYSDDPTTSVQDMVDPYTYSTTETRIGTWIDGKPIYRKVVVNQSFTISTSGTKFTNIPNIDTWVSSYLRVGVSGSGGKASGRTGYINANYYSGIQLGGNGDITLYAKEDTNTVRYVQLIMEYTKTTD